MNILIDTSPLKNLNAIRGVGRYTNELVTALRLLNTTHQFFTSEDHPKSVDVIHYPFFDLFYPTLPLHKKAKTVVTIHDVIPLVFPRHYPIGVKGKLSFAHQMLSLRGVSHVITDSTCSKRDLVDHLRLRSDGVTAISLAASSSFYKRTSFVIETARKKYEIPKNYVLYVGDINYNKNLPFLIKVMSHIPDITLVIAGAAVKNTSIREGKLIRDTIQQQGSGKYVRLVDSVASQDDLIALYSGAKAYVQPSLYEGFGLPVIEAMRCKTPVVSSCGGSLSEVVSDAGLQFNPTDAGGCESMIRKVLRMDDSERARMVRKAYEYSLKFSWERTAQETLSVYEKLQ